VVRLEVARPLGVVPDRRTRVVGLPVRRAVAADSENTTRWCALSLSCSLLSGIFNSGTCGVRLASVAAQIRPLSVDKYATRI
jgi:hypothetical protein